MLKFFRTIRKKLIEEDNVRKPASPAGRYLLYAIGEILLVVIGILIALQVNNWNESRLERAERSKLLSNLNEEFVQNKKLIRESLTARTEIFEAGLTIMDFIGRERSDFEGLNIDSLFYAFLGTDDYSISKSSIDNIIQSGKMNLIKNQKLVNKIYEWEALNANLMARDKKLDDWSYAQVMPLMTKHISFKEMDAMGGFRWAGESRLDHDFYPLFQDLVFENIVDNTLFLNRQVVDRLKEADSLAEEIIQLTKEN